MSETERRTNFKEKKQGNQQNQILKRKEGNED